MTPEVSNLDFSAGPWAARYHLIHGPVLGRGPGVEDHCCRLCVLVKKYHNTLLYKCLVIIINNGREMDREEKREGKEITWLFISRHSVTCHKYNIWVECEITHQNQYNADLKDIL